MVKTPYCDKHGVKKGAWSEEDNNKLRAYIERYGHLNWRLVPKRGKKWKELHALQHFTQSPATFSSLPGRHVDGDTYPGRLVARDKLKGKARHGFFPGRLSRATWWGPQVFSQTNMCHGG
ncbi:homeodomain-like protein [Tanacetum coccineum]